MQPSTPYQQRMQRWRPDVRSKGPATSAKHVTSMLKTAKTPQELLRLLQQHKLQQQGGFLNAIHVAAAFYRLGWMCQLDAAVAGTLAAQQLLQHLGELLLAVQQQLGPRELSNIVWACAHAKHIGPVSQLLSAFVQREMLSAANSQDVANIVWAVGKLGHRVPQQQPSVLVAAFTAEGVLGRAKIQDIANLMWGVSELQEQLPAQQQLSTQQLDLMLAAFVKQLSLAVPQHISNTLLACARFRHDPVPLLEALEKQQHPLRLLAAAKPQELANIASAYAMLGHGSEPVLGGVLQQAVKLLQQDNNRFVCQELCNLCWAVAVLDLPQYVPAVLQLAQAACSDSMWESAAPEGLRQLYQVHLWLKDSTPAAAQGAKVPGLLQVLSQLHLEECSRSWKDQVAYCAAATPSLLQREAVQSLEVLTGWQVPPKQEERTRDKNFSIDIFAVTTAGVRLAVEVDGPTHFVSPGNKVDGRTKYRDRALKARGYTVVSIPGWEWEKLQGAKQKQEYLVNKLKGETVLVVSVGLQLLCP
jgi:hypothetical protein